MAQHIQIRGDIASVWTSVNPILNDRELAYEKDTQSFKVGDGVTAWNSLPYMQVRRELERINVSVVAGPPNILTLDMANRNERKFEVTSAQTAAFTIAFANVGSAEFIHLVVPITGTVVVTLPSNVVCSRLESRWNNTSKTITLISIGTADIFELSLDVIGGPRYVLKASESNFAA